MKNFKDGTETVKGWMLDTVFLINTQFKKVTTLEKTGSITIFVEAGSETYTFHKNGTYTIKFDSYGDSSTSNVKYLHLYRDIMIGSFENDLQLKTGYVESDDVFIKEKNKICFSKTNDCLK